MKDYLLALDAGGTFLKAGLFEGQSPVAGSFCSHPANSNGTTEEVHAAYTALLAEMRNRAEAMGGRITGVVADIPGPFDYKNGISQMKHKYTAICGVPLRPWFAEVLGDVPVRFLHDSAAFILGAAETIRRCRPKLLLAAYHRSEDLFALPQLVFSIRSDYQLYLRHHQQLPAWDVNFYFV